MARKSHGGSYPPDWQEISKRVKEDAGWKCIRCGHPDDRESGHMLTVHHLDMNPGNCAWWNLAALCQKCHLRIQAKVIMERPWLLEHSEWFKPFVAGYYASQLGLPTDREFVREHMNRIIAIGMGRTSNSF